MYGFFMSLEAIKKDLKGASGASTRQLIIEAAQIEIHRVGFRSASVSQILKATKLTKGAFYHHFKSKKELGLAVVNEALKQRTEDNWIKPFAEFENPVDGLIEHLMYIKEAQPHGDLICGCPLNNIAQEMSSVDEDFRLAINNIFADWINGLEELFKKGQQNGYVKKSISARSIATFIIASLEGLISLTKNSQTTDCIEESTETFRHFLNSLRP